MRSVITTVALAALLLSSAVAVVVVKQRSRALTSQLQELTWEADRLQTEWDQLQLEEATLANHGRVESQARRKLTMAEPARTVPLATLEVRP